MNNSKKYTKANILVLINNDQGGIPREKPYQSDPFDNPLRESVHISADNLNSNARFLIKVCHFNPNTFAGLVGKVQNNKLSPEGGRKGGWRKKARAARPPDPGLEPGTCRVLGEGPPLHARGAV